jgi:3-methyl-2-oxobutanoate hydroxymethyltransferase
MRGEPTLVRKDLAYLQARKRAGAKIAMLTCYDYPTAVLEERAGVDIIFVGDSVGTNVLGYASEREVTMADMLHHLRAVRRGVTNAYLLVDLPFGAYATPAQALANARLLRDAGADGVKLEGGLEQVEMVRALVEAGIEVCGHLGYTPQTLAQPGRRPAVQGRSFDHAVTLLRSALALEAAGLALLVLELVPGPLAKLATERLTIPVIGIGAGRDCDGQVLVVNDVLGITPFRLKIARRYQEYDTLTLAAIGQYRREVEAGLFPADENSFGMDEAELARVVEWLSAVDALADEGLR